MLKGFADDTIHVIIRRHSLLYRRNRNYVMTMIKVFGSARYETVCGFALLDKSTLRQNHVIQSTADNSLAV